MSRSSPRRSFNLLVTLAVCWLFSSCTPDTGPLPQPTGERPSPTSVVISTTPSPILAPPALTATYTPFPTATQILASPTFPPTLLPALTNPSPGIDEVQNFIDSGEMEGEIVKLISQDVSGDGQTDLVAITDLSPVYILIWEGDRYRRPEVTGVWPEGRDGLDGRFVYLKDYTGDHIPEVVNDTWAARGDDTYTVIDWERQITFCEAEGCRVVWEDWTGSYGDAPTSTGMFYYNSSDYVYRNDQLQLILERRYFGFVIFWPYQDTGLPPLSPEHNAAQMGWDTRDKVYKDVEIIRRYAWDGEVYEFLNDEMVTGPELDEKDVLLEARGPQNAVASIRLELDTTSTVYRNDRCEVYLNGSSISKPFACKHQFTNLAWEDVIGDDRKELLVRTISGDQSYKWSDLFADKGCFHQRLIIFQWDGQSATQVANVTGCIRRSNLFGVRLTDYDNDGQIEILAATLWPEFLERDQPDGISQNYLQVNQLVEIYEWDGEKFVIGATLGEP